GHPDQAVPLLEDSLPKWKALVGPDHVDTLINFVGLDIVYVRAGQPYKAAALMDDFIADARRRAQPSNARQAESLKWVGRDFIRHEQYRTAEKVLRATQQIWTQYWPDVWGTFDAQALLGRSLLGQTKYASARPLLVQGYEGMKKRAANIPE